jgi:hypothetical protein
MTLSGDCPYSRMTYSFFKTAVPGKQKIVIWVGPSIVISDRYCYSTCVGAFGRLKPADSRKVRVKAVTAFRLRDF